MPQDTKPRLSMRIAPDLEKFLREKASERNTRYTNFSIFGWRTGIASVTASAINIDDAIKSYREKASEDPVRDLREQAERHGMKLVPA